MRKLLLAGVAAPMVMAAISPAYAQSTSPSKTGDDTATASQVIVTVRKRAENVLDVPDTVTVVTQKQMDDLRLQDARDAIQLVPTAFLSEGDSGTNRDFNIRGVGTPNLFAESGVATYVDQVYSSDYISYPTQFYDLDQIDVLSGPQGALYGQDAVGGAVNIISHDPTGTLGGYARAAYGSYNRYELEGMVNLPLNEDNGLRFVGWNTSQTEGEYYDPLTRTYLDKNNSAGGRVVYKGELANNLTLRVIGETTEANTPGTILYFPEDGETPKDIPRDTNPTNHFTTSRISAQLDWRTDLGTFTLIGGYRTYDLTGIEDTDLSACFAPCAAAPDGKEVTNRKNTVVSNYNELRWLSRNFGPLTILAGATYLDDVAHGDIDTSLPFLAAAYGAPAQLAISNGQSTQAWSAYVEPTWKLPYGFSLIGDLRYTSETKNEDFDYAPSPLLSFAGLGTPATLDTSKTFTNLSPGVTLAWDPDSDWHAYAKVQTGFRAGGFNFNVESLADLPYNPETSINYEVGIKRQLWDRGTIGLAIFHMDQNHVLTFAFDPTAAAPLESYLTNDGTASTTGVELQGSYRIMPGLDVSGSVGWLDAKFTSGPDKNLVLPTAVPLTTSLVASYRTPIYNKVDFLLNGVYNHRASGYSTDNENPLLMLSEVNELNISSGFEFSQRYQILGYVQNALNDQYITSYGGFRSPDDYGQERAPGRTFGIQLKTWF